LTLGFIARIHKDTVLLAQALVHSSNISIENVTEEYVSS
jgi:hypothetical protein